MEGPVAEALESKDTGDLGKRPLDAWPDRFACNIGWFDVNNVMRPSSFCSSWVTRLSRILVMRREAECGLGTCVGSDFRVRLRLGRSCKKQCFPRR